MTLIEKQIAVIPKTNENRIIRFAMSEYQARVIVASLMHMHQAIETERNLQPIETPELTRADVVVRVVVNKLVQELKK
jgi:hypothetical protein